MLQHACRHPRNGESGGRCVFLARWRRCADHRVARGRCGTGEPRSRTMRASARRTCRGVAGRWADSHGRRSALTSARAIPTRWCTIATMSVQRCACSGVRMRVRVHSRSCFAKRYPCSNGKPAWIAQGTRAQGWQGGAHPAAPEGLGWRVGRGGVVANPAHHREGDLPAGLEVQSASDRDRHLHSLGIGPRPGVPGGPVGSGILACEGRAILPRSPAPSRTGRCGPIAHAGAGTAQELIHPRSAVARSQVAVP